MKTTAERSRRVCREATFILCGAMHGIALLAENFGWDATILSWIIVALIGALFSVFALGRYSGFIDEEK